MHSMRAQGVIRLSPFACAVWLCVQPAGERARGGNLIKESYYPQRTNFMQILSVYDCTQKKGS